MNTVYKNKPSVTQRCSKRNQPNQSVGVKASVETTKDGKSVLKLTSKETGTGQFTFIVNGEFC